MDELRPVSQFSYRSHLNRAEVWNRRCWSSSSTAATSKPLKAATRGNAQNFPRLASLFDSISGKFTLKNVILSTQRPIIAGVVHQNSVSPNQKHLKKTWRPCTFSKNQSFLEPSLGIFGTTGPATETRKCDHFEPGHCDLLCGSFALWPPGGGHDGPGRNER